MCGDYNIYECTFLMCAFVWDSLCLCVCVTVCLCICACFYVPVFVCLSFSQTVCLCVSVCLSFCQCVCLSVPVSLCIWVFVSLSLSLSMCMRRCMYEENTFLEVLMWVNIIISKSKHYWKNAFSAVSPGRLFVLWSWLSCTEIDTLNPFRLVRFAFTTWVLGHKTFTRHSKSGIGCLAPRVITVFVRGLYSGHAKAELFRTRNGFNSFFVTSILVLRGVRCDIRINLFVVECPFEMSFIEMSWISRCSDQTGCRQWQSALWDLKKKHILFWVRPLYLKTFVKKAYFWRNILHRGIWIVRIMRPLLSYSLSK